MKCDICQQNFINKKSLSNHRRWHDLPEYKRFQESYCCQVSIFNKGSKNGQWVGDKIQYDGVHGWVHRNFPKPKKCSDCGLVKKLEAANKSGKYLRDVSDWEWVCRRCHMKKDGRLSKVLRGLRNEN